MRLSYFKKFAPKMSFLARSNKLLRAVTTGTPCHDLLLPAQKTPSLEQIFEVR
jgi:hypothetical protein